MSAIKHPLPANIMRGTRLFYLRENKWVTLCNCAGVSNYLKVGWAKSHPSEYSLTKPVEEPVPQLGNSGVESAE
jgi:hypothetical protein